MRRARFISMLSMSSLVTATLLTVALAVPAGAGTSDDQTIADDSTLTIDDINTIVGEGLTEEPPDDSEQEFEAPSCTAIRKAAKLVKKGPHAETEFGIEAGEAFANINNIVGVFANPRRAKAVYAAYAGPKAADCLEEAYTEAIAAQNPDDEATVTVEEFAPDAGDASVGYEGQVQSDGGGFYFEIVFVRVGRAIDGFYFVNSGSAPPSDDTAQLVEDGVTRLTDNLAA